jgi:hypothetical protein
MTDDRKKADSADDASEDTSHDGGEATEDSQAEIEETADDYDTIRAIYDDKLILPPMPPRPKQQD